jgi:predicted CoA-substrate-specific enzyme activase
MNLSLEEGIEQSMTGKRVPLATRCSVHCKSDATHKLNKGECAPGDIAKSLIYDLAEKIYKMIDQAQWPQGLVVLSGGVTLNKPFVKNLQEILGADSKVKVIPESPYLEAFGASLFALELPEIIKMPPRHKWLRAEKTTFETLSPLTDKAALLDYRVTTDETLTLVDGASYILGIDAGSTTTKGVLLNTSDKTVGASSYLRTHGNPILATKNVIADLIKQVGEKDIKIIQTGVTGSGREMDSVYLDNCLSFNEILAHARAATEEVPDVDTVFEIGGQDSKFVSFLEGIPVDYAMNEGCSAGTGSFLEESASIDMGIPMREISGVAEKSEKPLAFGERCAAFINTDLRSAKQLGAGQEDVTAGLVYSIADNYISRIVGSRYVGENLLFQGGVALNKSVALAMVARTGRKVVVPPHPELMGCVGTCLMAMDLLESGDIEEKIYKLSDLVKGDMETKGTFRCKSCENTCEIQMISIRGGKYPFGGLCSKFELERHAGKKEIQEGQDMVAVRNKMMFEEFGPEELKNPRGTIGLAMSLTVYELFPFYAKLINELGYNVVLSEPSKEGNAKTCGDMCYPCEIAHGATFDLLNKGVDYIFLPRTIELEIPDGFAHAYTCPTTTIIPDVVRSAFGRANSNILSPHIGLSKHLVKTTLQEIALMGQTLGISETASRKAGQNAIAHYNQFKEAYLNMGRQEMGHLLDQPTVIIAGRSYMTCSPQVNLALPRKITSRGFNAVPVDMLPQLSDHIHKGNVWGATQQIMNAVSYAKKYPDVYVCFLSCFSCGPDATIYHFIRQEIAGKTFCYLEIDSHTAHAGFETRVSAFLDIIEETRRRAKAQHASQEPTKQASLA